MAQQTNPNIAQQGLDWMKSPSGQNYIFGYGNALSGVGNIGEGNYIQGGVSLVNAFPYLQNLYPQTFSTNRPGLAGSLSRNFESAARYGNAAQSGLNAYNNYQAGNYVGAGIDAANGLSQLDTAMGTNYIPSGVSSYLGPVAGGYNLYQGIKNKNPIQAIQGGYNLYQGISALTGTGTATGAAAGTAGAGAATGAGAAGAGAAGASTAGAAAGTAGAGAGTAGAGAGTAGLSAAAVPAAAVLAAAGMAYGANKHTSNAPAGSSRDFKALAIGGLGGYIGSKFFGSSKDKYQWERDRFRNILQKSGMIDDKWMGTLADGTMFDFGKDGKKAGKLDTSNPLWGDAAAGGSILAAKLGYSGKQQEAIATLIANAAMSNAGGDVSKMNANIAHLDKQWGRLGNIKEPGGAGSSPEKFKDPNMVGKPVQATGNVPNQTGNTPGQVPRGRPGTGGGVEPPFYGGVSGTINFGNYTGRDVVPANPLKPGSTHNLQVGGPGRPGPLYNPVRPGTIIPLQVGYGRPGVMGNRPPSPMELAIQRKQFVDSSPQFRGKNEMVNTLDSIFGGGR